MSAFFIAPVVFGIKLEAGGKMQVILNTICSVNTIYNTNIVNAGKIAGNEL